MTAVQMTPNPSSFSSSLASSLVWTDYRTGSSGIDLHITGRKPESLRAPLAPAHETCALDSQPPKRCLKSAPQTPTKSGQPKKIVKFADDMGLDLTAVKVMVATPPSQSPEENVEAVQSAAAPSKDPSVVPIVSVTNASPIKSLLIPQKEFLPTRNIKFEVCQSSGRYQAKFEQPGATAHFWQRVRAQKVCLESVIASYNSSVHIVIRVLNVAFHKSVILRYTLNNWGSYTDIEADYMPTECADIAGAAHATSPTDRFSVNLCLKSSPRSVQFCVCYRVDGKEYWDNNNHQNYKMEFEESQQPTPFY